jgi:putative DNA primase/helicase
VSSVLCDKLQSLGIPAPPEEVTESKVTRWGHNKRWWAVRFRGGYALGDWSSGLKDFAFEEGFGYDKCRRQIEEARRKLTQKRNDDNAEAAASARRIWGNAADCTTHPYLEAKKVKAHGLKIDRQTLLIPLYDERGNLASLQRIWPDPNKPGKFVKGFLKGSRIQGCCFTVGTVKDTVVICEGYATGATVREITGLPVVVAFSSNNLLNITRRTVKNYPRAGIIIAADNDRFKPGNPGLTKAKEAAAAVNARLAVPEFANDDGESSDFNDLYVLEGSEKVKAAFLTTESYKNNLRYTEETRKDNGKTCPVEPDRNSRSCPVDWTSSSNKLQVFFYNRKNVRTIQIEGKTLWILKDVCDAFGLKKYRDVITRLDKEETCPAVADTNKGTRKMIAVTESGLRRLLKHSNKPEAREFERWIAREALPSTGKTTLSPTKNVQEQTQFPPEKAQHPTQSAGETKKTKEKETSPGEEHEIVDPDIPEGFRLTDKALYCVDRRGESTYLCSYLRVLSKTINIDSGESGKLLEFRTVHGEIKKICMKNKDLFCGNAQIILKDLAGAGLHINLEAPTKKILIYINNCLPENSTKTTGKNGWILGNFLTENGIISIDEHKEDLFLDTAFGSTHVAASGSLDDWRENVGKPCSGNSRLVLAVSAAFAAPLLYILDRPNFGIQLVGKSSTGKTTALRVAASVYGPHAYVKSWRATDNGLENVAFNHNDMLLILDELGEMSPQKIGAAVYMLANGSGKTRANTSGDAKQPKTWRIALLAAGEIDLNTHMASAGIAAMAGQNIRLLAVPAIPNGKCGLIENTHGFATPTALIKHLLNATERYYGTPLPKYVGSIMKDKQNIIRDFEDSLELTKKEALPPNADGQDNRVFDLFFAVGFAGELAAQYGITEWPRGETIRHSMLFFKEWIARKGGYGNQEEKKLLYSLRCFFQKHQCSRFLQLNQYNELEQKIANEAIGYRKDVDDSMVFYAYPERLKDALKREIAADIDDILKLADGLGILKRDDGDDHFTKVVRVGKKSKRMLVFNSKVLADEEQQ